MLNPLWCEVNSIEDYLSTIERLPYGKDGYYFRGENRRFACQNSRLLRHTFSRLLRDNPQYYVDVVNDYMHDMADEAGIWEQEHVLAWCHQEGQPTNLLELTTSPLQALFYASLYRTDGSLERGQEIYVYGYAKTNTVDATPLILENTKMSSTRYNLLEDMNDDPRWNRMVGGTDIDKAIPKESLPDLSQFPYLTYEVPPRHRDSHQSSSLYFYQLFQLRSASDSELPYDLITQQYTPALVIKVTGADQIRQELRLRSEDIRI
ncbi:FRG domain-containing protein [Paenibacillus silvae]|uniref:FRG domain-containing protein n=1 Tax=Paenibacillus silvae TaxID=1325358 RepID=UPI0011A422D3|nr:MULTISPECIES: FRG domain-containing protein [Paenibacillus]MCK6076765.1 hypothetical protein [Paenibacillus silvae]MCK6151191.1 hypothetical protein [Paenibacillus silvae]MCK6269451.1 hypothetical protein [Paenibacillus silvae]